MTARDRVVAAFEAVAALDDPAVFLALADADAALARLDPGAPLAGSTFAVKDNIDVAGLPTTAGCPSYRYLPERSAPVVARLEAAGAICVGKTNLDQFATGLVGTRSPHGTPRNPLDPALVPGGSSSGSAVAVALGLVDVALGTDTAGSGRVPAAHLGIVGLKPTRGLLPTTGVVPAVRSLDCVSVFARTATDAWTALTTTRGPDRDDPFSRTPGPGPCPGPVLRVGVPDPVDLDGPADRRAWAAALDRLADGALGPIELVEIDPGPFLAAGDLLYGGPWVAERHLAVGAFLTAGVDGGPPPDADPVVAAIIGAGADHRATDAYTAAYRLAELANRTAVVWRSVDVLAFPTVPGVATLAEVAADPVGRNTRLGRYTNFVNLLDLCGAAVPGPTGDGGRPFGLTFLAPAWADALVADLAARWCVEQPGAAAAEAAGAWTDLVVVGAHLTGLPLNHQLTDLGGRFVRTDRTAAAYRFWELAPSAVRKPGLIHIGPGGASIEVEVWRLPRTAVGAFLARIPPPLGLGTIELADGSTLTGFIAEPRAVEGATDISATGGWRSHLAGS